MTERDLQLAIYHHRRSIQPWPVLICNVYHWDWESDALFVSKDGYLTEYECKVTLSDFKADAAKERKHLMMSNGNGPKQFYYVCPENLIPVELIPAHAGLAYAVPLTYHFNDEPDGIMTLRIIKRAPARKVEPIKPERREALLTKAIDRYWTARMENVRLWERLKQPQSGGGRG